MNPPAGKTDRLSATLVVCTRNRIAEVRRLLESVVSQTRLPDQTLIVDGGPTAAVEVIAGEFMGRLSNLKYLTVDGDLTPARNLGIRHATGDIVFFLDDDLILDTRFVESLMGVFESDPQKRYGGACGTLENYHVSSGWRAWLNRLFFMPHDGDGRLRLSGAAAWVYGRSMPQDVEFLPGGLTAYRREVFAKERFDEKMPAFGYTEDVDFSWRASKHFRNRYEPTARAIHERPPNDRAMRFEVLRTWIWAYWRTYRRNRPYGWRGYPALVLLSIGYVLKFLDSQLRRAAVTGDNAAKPQKRPA